MSQGWYGSLEVDAVVVVVGGCGVVEFVVDER